MTRNRRRYGGYVVHLGVVFIVNMEIGYVAPPIATNLFVSAAISESRSALLKYRCCRSGSSCERSSTASR